MKKENLWLGKAKENKDELNEICERYKKCLDEGKTERECVAISIKMAQEKGYQELYQAIEAGNPIKAGDKFYVTQMNKSLALFQIGTQPISSGMNILGAHIDSPRIDVKQNPLYENDGFAYLDTHYYGGIKKYQWTAIPLALHGVISKKDGTTVVVNIGEKEDDPVFVITDLLVHLAKEQMAKKASEVVEGESLDLLIGNCPLEKNEDLEKEEKEAIKANPLLCLPERFRVPQTGGLLLPCRTFP